MDTGATDSLVPRSCIKAISLESDGQRVDETADGREIRMDFVRADIEFMGDVTARRVIIGDEGTESLLGVTALESTGIEVDPVNQRLKRAPLLGTRASRPHRSGRVTLEGAGTPAFPGATLDAQRRALETLIVQINPT